MYFYQGNRVRILYFVGWRACTLGQRDGKILRNRKVEIFMFI